MGLLKTYPQSIRHFHSTFKFVIFYSSHKFFLVVEFEKRHYLSVMIDEPPITWVIWTTNLMVALCIYDLIEIS